MVADLVHNVGRRTGAWTAFYAKAMGFYDRLALSRALRSTAVSDRPAFRRSLDQVLALPFERLVVAHGAPLGEGAREAFAEAFAWVPKLDG